MTIGGSLCMGFSRAGWRSDFTLESVLVQVRAALLEGGGKLDPRRAHVPYSETKLRAFCVSAAARMGAVNGAELSLVVETTGCQVV